jgi:hypothetical protein
MNREVAMHRRIVLLAGMVVALLGSAAPARAQGCVLCYTSALAAGKGVEDALRNGVLVLLVPVALLLIGAALLVWHKSSVVAS